MIKISTVATIGLLAIGASAVTASPAFAVPMGPLSTVTPTSDIDQVRYDHHGYRHHHGFRHHHHGYRHHGYRHHRRGPHPIGRLLRRL